MELNKQRCEKVSWAYIKRETGLYKEEDDNDGLHYGLHIYEHCDDYVDIVECEWFATPEEREASILEQDLFVLDEYI